MKDFTMPKLMLNLGRFPMVMLAIALLSSLGNAQAAQRDNRHPFLAVPRHGHGSVHLSVSHMVFSNSGTHYLYVDDGTTPDSIDVYAVTRTLTHIGNFPNNASRTIFFLGATTLAVAKMNSTHGACVLLLDNSGFVDSFSVVSGGGLSAEVSHIADSGNQSDVAVAEDGNTAYVSNLSVDLESYSIGSGCVLKSLHTLATPTQGYSSFALISPTRLVAPDSNSTNIDTYALGSGGTITFLKSVAGQFSCPDSIAVQKVETDSGSVTNVFTGQGCSEAISQGGQYHRKTGNIAFLRGSPSTDPSGSGGVGISLAFDNRDSLLIQGELFTDALAVYAVTPGVPGTPGHISFKEHIPLANPNSENPDDFAQLGSTLFVNMTFNGDLEACTISSKGVSGCATIATLTNTSGTESGLALL